MRHDELSRRLKAELSRLVDELFASGEAPRTIEEIEAAALQLRQKAGERVAEELAQAAEEQAQAEEGDPKKVCCSCGRWARRRGRRQRDVVTMAGRVRVRRAYYYCRLCDAGVCPTDRALGLGSGPFTRRVVQEVVRLDALAPYGKAMALLWDLAGVSVSAKEAQRMLERSSEVVQSYEEARWGAALQQWVGKKARAEVLYLFADGVQTPILGGWRETKVGVARALDADGKLMGSSRYVSLLGDAEAFGWKLAALAQAAGATHAGRLVMLGDGARWIWTQAEAHFPEALQVLDLWHAVQRLWEVGRLAFGEQEGPLKEWVAQRQSELWEYRTDALIEALSRLAALHVPAREKAQEAIGYYENNRERMDYPRYREMGLLVGSGPVESGCKQVVTQRLKGAGMRWREAGAQTIARLRCLILGGEWQSFLQHWNRATPAAAF
jgi:hypothetical protein